MLLQEILDEETRRMIHFDIHKSVHTYIEALDGVFSLALCALAEVVYFLLDAAVDKVKSRCGNDHDQEEDAGIEPDYEHQDKENHQCLTKNADKGNQDTSCIIDRIKMNFVQKISGSLVYDLVKWLVDDMVKSPFRKVLDQLSAKPVHAALYKDSHNILEQEEKNYPQDKENKER